MFYRQIYRQHIIVWYVVLHNQFAELFAAVDDVDDCASMHFIKISGTQSANAVVFFYPSRQHCFGNENTFAIGNPHFFFYHREGSPI